MKKSSPLYLPIDSTIQFGQCIRNARKQAGFTLKEATVVLGVGIRFLSELERGKPTIELAKALKVAQRLGMDICIKVRQ